MPEVAHRLRSAHTLNVDKSSRLKLHDVQTQAGFKSTDTLCGTICIINLILMTPAPRIARLSHAGTVFSEHQHQPTKPFARKSEGN